MPNKLKFKLKIKARRRQETRTAGVKDQAGVYRGKQTKTGNSLALRFDRALFHSHPEFNGEVEAHVISPGRMLVVAERTGKGQSSAEDPVFSSFMSCLAADIQRLPQHIAPLNAALIEEIGSMVSDVSPSPDEDLGDEALI